MEAEKSHHLLPASWRPRKTGSKVQEDVSYQAIRQGEPKLPLPFGSVQALSGLDMPHPNKGEGHRLTQCTNSMLTPSRNTVTKHVQNSCSTPTSGYPMGQSS